MRTSTGAGTPTPTASTSDRAASTESTISVSSSAARSSPWSARWSGGSGMRCSATIRWATSDRATRSERVPKCMPATRPRLRASVTCCARRPLREVGAVCRTPALVSSLTMFDTVAGDRPVTPASSTCVSEPRCWTALTIRARLASRSEVWEPGVTRSLPTREGYTGRSGAPDAGSDLTAAPNVRHRTAASSTTSPVDLRLDRVNCASDLVASAVNSAPDLPSPQGEAQITIWRRIRSFLDFKRPRPMRCDPDRARRTAEPPTRSPAGAPAPPGEHSGPRDPRPRPAAPPYPRQRRRRSHMRTARKFTAVAAGLAVASLALAACSSGDSGDDATSGTGGDEVEVFTWWAERLREARPRRPRRRVRRAEPGRQVRQRRRRRWRRLATPRTVLAVAPAGQRPAGHVPGPRGCRADRLHQRRPDRGRLGPVRRVRPARRVPGRPASTASRSTARSTRSRRTSTAPTSSGPTRQLLKDAGPRPGRDVRHARRLVRRRCDTVKEKPAARRSRSRTDVDPGQPARDHPARPTWAPTATTACGTGRPTGPAPRSPRRSTTSRRCSSYTNDGP